MKRDRKRGWAPAPESSPLEVAKASAVKCCVTTKIPFTFPFKLTFKIPLKLYFKSPFREMLCDY